jgi:rRNA maturation protein Nop10
MAEATHVCPMHSEITGLKGDTCSKCGMDLVASADESGEMEHTDMAATHACPMHPEITGLEGDTCSKCGMDLTLAEVSEEEQNQ